MQRLNLNGRKERGAKNKLQPPIVTRPAASFLRSTKERSLIFAWDRASVKFRRFCQFRRVGSDGIRRRFRGRISPFFAIVRRVRVHSGKEKKKRRGTKKGEKKKRRSYLSLSPPAFLFGDARRFYRRTCTCLQNDWNAFSLSQVYSQTHPTYN